MTGELRKRILAAMAANGIQIPAPIMASGMPVSSLMSAGPVPRSDLGEDQPGANEPPGDRSADA